MTEIVLAAGVIALFTVSVSALDAVHQLRKQVQLLQETVDELCRSLETQNFSDPKKPAWLLRPLLIRRKPEAPSSPS